MSRVCFKVKRETQHKVETLFKPCDRVSVVLVCATAVRLYSHAHSHGFAAQLKGQSLAHILRTILMVTLGLYSQYWLLINVSGFTSPHGALLCMLVCRAMFSVPYIHVNIFQVRTRCL